ncbi:MAG: transposase [Anaerolineales bacterium]|nr:transposase [Anaerolineales bacterium]
MSDGVRSGAWHHSPPHLFVPNCMYMITASTLEMREVFNSEEKLELLENTLLEVTAAYGWELEAWVVFSNHYHFIARSPGEANNLKRMIQRLHSQSARLVNALDGTPGRRVWFQYWDTILRDERGYLARLNYVEQNPVKHGMVEGAGRYRLGSVRRR